MQGRRSQKTERRMVWQFACVTVRNGLSSHIKEAMSARKSLSFTVDPGTYYIEVKNQSYYSLSAGVKKVKDLGGDSKKDSVSDCS